MNGLMNRLRNERAKRERNGAVVKRRLGKTKKKLYVYNMTR